jgi:two-component system, cell cycle response regulator
LVRIHREQGCTSILMGDVDYFKRVNDTYGHAVGDEVLKEIAHRLLASVRSYDFVGRYGGEEFLIVLNSCDASFALARAEEIRKAIAQDAVQTSRGLVAVTMSFGVLSSKDWGARPVEDLLRETDAALYASKAAGRNCCKIAKRGSVPQDSLAPQQISPVRAR